MEQNSLRLKVVRLAQRSRRAIRLYTSVYNSASSKASGNQSSSSSISPITPGLSATLGSSADHLDVSDFSNSFSESHTLGSRSMAALSTRGSSSRTTRSSGERFSEMQAAEWRDVNLSLLRSLTSALEEPRQRDLPKRIIQIRDSFWEQWRSLKMALQGNRAEAISAAERADFINLAILSEGLVSLKARCQASEAAYHELSEVCKGISVAAGIVSDLRPTSAVTNKISNVAFEQQPIFQGISAANDKTLKFIDETDRTIQEFPKEKIVRRDNVATLESDSSEDEISSTQGTSEQVGEDSQKVIMLKMAFS